MTEAHIEEINEKFRRMRLALDRQEKRDQMKKPVVRQVEDWLSKSANWSIGFSLHAADGLRREQQGYDHYWMEAQISTLFNTLSKVIYQDIPVRQRPKLRRIVALEDSTDVGWHAHGVIQTPGHISDDMLIEALKNIWHGRMDDYCRAYFRDRLVWCEPIKGNYLNYSLKNALENSFANQDNKAGMISLRNTVL